MAEHLHDDHGSGESLARISGRWLRRTKKPGLAWGSRYEVVVGQIVHDRDSMTSYGTYRGFTKAPFEGSESTYNKQATSKTTTDDALIRWQPSSQRSASFPLWAPPHYRLPSTDRIREILLLLILALACLNSHTALQHAHVARSRRAPGSTRGYFVAFAV